MPFDVPSLTLLLPLLASYGEGIAKMVLEKAPRDPVGACCVLLCLV